METENNGQDGSKRVTAKRFAEILKIGQPALTKMWDTRLTLNESYFLSANGRNKMVDLEAARKELSGNTNVRTCKEPGILAFIGKSKDDGLVDDGVGDDISLMNPKQVREARERSELRVQIMNERKQAGELVEKKLVEKNLASMGILVRDKIVAMRRVVPLCRAAASDLEAENLFDKEAEDVLINLSSTLAKDVAAE